MKKQDTMNAEQMKAEQRYRRGVNRMMAGLAPAALILLFWTGLPSPAGGQRLTGFPDSEAARQRDLEARLVESIQPPLLEELNRDMSREPHVAGSDAQRRVAGYILGRFTGWGLDAEFSTYEIYLPWPTDVSLALLTPRPGGSDWVRTEMRLREEVVPSDPVTVMAQFPWVNGYSGAGSVEAEVVYVNYGLHEDYAQLEEAGVSVAGKVALARYGRSFRGIKARLAEEHRALALIMYSDPADDGYVRGDVYPEGPFRPASAVQRGSVIGHWGDPTTPGWPSLPGAERLDPHREGHWVPAIPVIPLNWAQAEKILAHVNGTPIPDQGWQGGLGLRYHLGPGPARVALAVAHDEGFRDIHDVVATIPGSEFPDEWVVLGGHADAWNAGSGDNVSGTASVMAAAQAFAALLRDGVRPRRTVVFAAWDAEEWGIIGSTEWAEEHRDPLWEGGVAYLNQDGVAGGPRFSGSGSPSLKSFLVEAARAVAYPDGGTLEEAWTAQQGVAEIDGVELGNLGGGSDYVGFYNHIGVPSLGHGFGGASGIGHSAYDTYVFMKRFADPEFLWHTTSSRLIAVAALRLANATLLPYDYERFGRELATIVESLPGEERTAAEREALQELADAFRLMEATGRAMKVARRTALEIGVGPERAAAVNRELRMVERAMTREEGLVGRPWFKNLVFAADYDNGYATIAVPSVQEAIKAGDPDRVVREATDLTSRVEAAVDHLIAAMGEMR